MNYADYYAGRPQPTYQQPQYSIPSGMPNVYRKNGAFPEKGPLPYHVAAQQTSNFDSVQPWSQINSPQWSQPGMGRPVYGGGMGGGMPMGYGGQQQYGQSMMQPGMMRPTGGASPVYGGTPNMMLRPTGRRPMMRRRGSRSYAQYTQPQQPQQPQPQYSTQQIY
jgi:hypothetical protein